LRVEAPGDSLERVRSASVDRRSASFDLSAPRARARRYHRLLRVVAAAEFREDRRTTRRRARRDVDACADARGAV